MANIDNNTAEIQRMNYSYGAMPPKIESFICFNDDSLFNGYFDMGNGSICCIGNAYGLLGSNETRKQVVKYNDDKTATVETYYIDDKGRTDSTVDEIITVSLDGRSASGSTIPVINSVEYNIDSKIDNYMQGEKQDCSFLACLSSISQTSVGKDILKDAIVQNDDNTYSVTFKGIQKTVKITQEEILEASKSGKYANGDKTVLLLELGAEKAINDLYNEIGITNDDLINYYTGSISDERKNNVAEFISTYWNTGLFDTCMDAKEGESAIDHFSPQKFAQIFGIPINKDNFVYYEFTGNDFNRFANILYNVDLSNSLTNLSFKKEAEFTSDKGNEFKIITDHAYTIKQYNEDEGTVTIINPHNSHDSLTISIAEVFEYGYNFQIINLNN